MIKILTIVGARPQFIKAAVLSRLIKSDKWKEHFTETIVHTGQHYDANMSEIFFDEMNIPRPDIHLNIGGGTHGQMTGEMLIKIEEQLIKLKPDLVLIYGDTNSTIAGSLAASKLNIPTVHVEAGLRSFWKKMPEEQNRILTDHLANWLFCPSITAVENLAKESITKNVFNVGDIMLDANIYYRQLLEDENGISRLSKIPNIEAKIKEGDFILATVHRAENTDDRDKLNEIISAFNEFEYSVILPLHPRTRKIISESGFTFNENVTTIEPVGFFEMLDLEMKSKCIITDSGGVQKEAYFIKKPCITLRDQTEWVETVYSGWNMLTGVSKEKILQAANNIKVPETHPNFYGDGNTGDKILSILSSN